MYKVYVACREHCENWEADRVMHVTDDADKAIREAEIFRDQNHEAWIEVA